MDLKKANPQCPLTEQGNQIVTDMEALKAVDINRAAQIVLNNKSQ